MKEMRLQSLGREDLLEKEMAAQSSALAWKIPQTEEPGGPQSTGHKESDTTERLQCHCQRPLMQSPSIAVLGAKLSGQGGQGPESRGLGCPYPLPSPWFTTGQRLILLELGLLVPRGINTSVTG